MDQLVADELPILCNKFLGSHESANPHPMRHAEKGRREEGVCLVSGNLHQSKELAWSASACRESQSNPGQPLMQFGAAGKEIDVMSSSDRETKWDIEQRRGCKLCGSTNDVDLSGPGFRGGRHQQGVARGWCEKERLKNTRMLVSNVVSIMKDGSTVAAPRWGLASIGQAAFLKM